MHVPRPDPDLSGNVVLAAAPPAVARGGATGIRRFIGRVLWGLIAALLLAAQPAMAQIALVQSTGMFGTTAGITATSTAFTSKPAIGDTIVVLVWTWTQNTAPTIVLSDSSGNTYTQVTQATILQGAWYESSSVYSAPVTSTANGLKVTVATPPNDSASQSQAVALEYSGVGAVDRVNSTTGSSATASVSTTAATSFLNELVVGVFGVDNPAVQFTTITPTSGYTVRAVQYQNAGATAGAGADQIVSAKAVQSITWTTAATLSGWAASIATFSPSSGVTPDHFAISNAGTAVNCQATPVTITAHNSSHAAVAATATIAVSTSTGHGDWSLTTGGGTFVAGAANSGTASYTYVSADNGAVVLSLKDTVAETLTINVANGSITQSSGSAIASEQLPLTFSPSGFRFTTGSNVATTIGTQVAGKTSTQSLALQAIRTDTNTGACTAAFASGTTVNISLAYQCNNPTTCVAGQTLAITNNSTTTNIASNPNSGVATYTSVPLRFSTANAEAPFTLNYIDVGQITLIARYNIPLGGGGASSTNMTGSGQFVVQPYSFTLSGIKCTTYSASTCSPALASPGNNPGATTAAGAAFIQAGQSFTATVTATNFNGATTPNYGREVSPQGVTLAANLQLPAAGNAAALNNASAFGAFSSGVATGTTFNWPEVGIITVTPSVASYLGSGTVTGTASGKIGRFIPNSFGTALNTPVIGTACSAGGYSYLGQPLNYTVAPVVTVTALAATGATARNYTGAFLKLTNASLTGRTYTPTPASPALDLSGLPAATTDPAIADLGNGQASLTFGSGTGLKFGRGGAIVPFSANLALGINVIDTDAVTAANPVTFGSGTGMSFSTGAVQRYGRLALRDGAGSELLDLPMSLTTQYYLSATQGFTTNADDSCTTAPVLSFSNYQLNLTAGETCVRDSGSPGASGVGCAAAAAASSRYLSTAVAGAFNLHLAAPGAGNAGALSVTATAPAWLQYSWASGTSPVGLGTFGVFPGPASRVHQREVY